MPVLNDDDVGRDQGSMCSVDRRWTRDLQHAPQIYDTLGSGIAISPSTGSTKVSNAYYGVLTTRVASIVGRSGPLTRDVLVRTTVPDIPVIGMTGRYRSLSENVCDQRLCFFGSIPVTCDL